MQYFHLADSTKPELRELAEEVVPNQAANWKSIGICLGIKSGELDIIEHDCYHKAVNCCISMFTKWLDVDENATWGKLKKILSSSAISCTSDSIELTTINGM